MDCIERRANFNYEDIQTAGKIQRYYVKYCFKSGEGDLSITSAGNNSLDLLVQEVVVMAVDISRLN